MDELPEIPLDELPEDARQAAVDARRFLQDPTTKRVMALMTSHYLRSLLDSAPGDKVLREHLHKQMLAVRDFGRQLTKLASKGTLEERRRSTRNVDGIS